MVEVLDHEIKLPAVMQMRPYQQRWIDDDSRFKAAVKSARIGFSFATAFRRVQKSLQIPGRTTTVLSASKAQSIEFVDTCSKFVQLMGASAQYFANEDFVDNIGRIDAIQSRVSFPNGARIIALPANARTARGYPGDAVLDEFAHHEDSYAIFAAVFRQVALGNSLEVLSTPNGEQGKFFDIAHMLGLDMGVAPEVLPAQMNGWSGHWIDVYRAVAEGCPINIAEMRAGLNDQDTWDQEFCCMFLKAVGAWLSLELVSTAETDEATMELPVNFTPRGKLYGGIDVARHHDATTMWIDEEIGGIFVTRMVKYIYAETFPNQARILAPFVRMCDRAAIDATGMGVALHDLLNEEVPGRVMGINFAGTNKPVKQANSPQSMHADDGPSIRLKVALAMLIKKKLEQGKSRIPRSTQIRTELMSIKRQATATGVTFDAPRIEVDSAVAGGGKTKRYSHADAFWAKALCDFAADGRSLELGMTASQTQTAATQMRSY